ncbi:MAG: DUF5916 domain-containing protein [Vicinamibacterales bacterium]
MAPRRRLSSLAIAVSCLVIVGTSSGSAQPASPQPGGPASRRVDPERAPRPTLRAVRVKSGAVVVDGRLDEAAWTDAPVASDFVQAQPSSGEPATEVTNVRVLFDDRRLYIGAECRDSEPGRLVVPSLEQDFESQDSDIFAVTLDTFHDRRNAFMFMVNPGGAVKDTQNNDDSRNENLAWEGVIDLRTAVHDWGWSVELAIPFTTIRFDPSRDPQTWGINFLRRIRRKNEDDLWAPLERRDRVHRMSKAGTLQGLEALRPGRNLTLKPFGLVSAATGTQRPPGANGRTADGGLDVKYGITPRLTLDLTWRTDFSQVEVDQEQVNLTRFSLFFPEKRDFFMENAGSFQLGDVADGSYRTGASLSDFNLFHSRRIGLTDSGGVIPILGGGRLTGRAAGFELGLLDMQTKATTSVPAENFAVLRVRRSVRGRADLGAMVVNRQLTGDRVANRDAFNRSYGLDVNLRPVRALAINSYVAATDAPSQHGDRRAARISVGWRDRLWDASTFVKQVGDGFDPGVGFVRRRAMRHAYGTFGAHPRTGLPHVQELNPYVELDYITNLRGVLESRQATTGLGVQFLDGGRLTVAVNDNFERLAQPFTVAAGAIVAPGDYPFEETTVSYNSSAGRQLSAKLNWAQGSFYDGDKTTIGASALWRPNAHVAADASVNHNTIDLHGRSYAVDVYGARVKVDLSTKLFVSAFVQLNAAADQRVLNVRLNYIHAPLSHFFVTYTERTNTSTASPAVLERVLTAKITKLLSF